MRQSFISFQLSFAVFALTACHSNDNEQAGPPLVFPAGFLFGTATSAHQVEGNLNNDWDQWERIAPDSSGECRIRECEKTSGATPAADWANGRYEEDFAAAAKMGNNTIRIGIEWARIEPAQGEISAAAVKYYHDMLASAKRHGLNPMVTVSHFTFPTWMQNVVDKGDGKFAIDAESGWRDPAIAVKFGAFAQFLATEYGAEVDYWCTINEPWGALLGAFLGGVFPPGYFLDLSAGVKAFHGMLKTHAAMYHALKKNDTQDADGDGVASYIGIVQHDRVALPDNPDNPTDVAAAKKADYMFGDVFNNAVLSGIADLDFDGTPETVIDGLAGTTDFWGLNYYGVFLYSSVIRLPPYLDAFPVGDAAKAGYPVNDLGWAIHPEGLRERLNYYWKKWGRVDGKTRFILVTENGIADSQDKLRAKFIVEHLEQILKASVQDGVDVRGYYHWSLVDNFEWHEGYEPKFGLIRLDPATQKRTETNGGRAYRAVIQANAVNEEIRAAFTAKPYEKPARIKTVY